MGIRSGFCVLVIACLLQGRSSSDEYCPEHRLGNKSGAIPSITWPPGRVTQLPSHLYRTAWRSVGDVDLLSCNTPTAIATSELRVTKGRRHCSNAGCCRGAVAQCHHWCGSISRYTNRAGSIIVPKITDCTNYGNSGQTRSVLSHSTADCDEESRFNELPTVVSFFVMTSESSWTLASERETQSLQTIVKSLKPWKWSHGAPGPKLLPPQPIGMVLLNDGNLLRLAVYDGARMLRLGTHHPIYLVTEENVGILKVLTETVKVAR